MNRAKRKCIRELKSSLFLPLRSRKLSSQKKLLLRTHGFTNKPIKSTSTTSRDFQPDTPMSSRNITMFKKKPLSCRRLRLALTRTKPPKKQLLSWTKNMKSSMTQITCLESKYSQGMTLGTKIELLRTGSSTAKLEQVRLTLYLRFTKDTSTAGNQLKFLVSTTKRKNIR